MQSLRPVRRVAELGSLDLMRTLLAITFFVVLGFTGYAQKTAPVSWKLQPPTSGLYGPDPSQRWYTGELVRIDGTNFHYTRFTDVAGSPVPAYTGRVVLYGDHIYLDHPGVPYPYRISGLLTNRPVLWTWEGYEQWKKTGKIDELGILYLEKPRVEQGAAANGSQPSRSQTNRTSSAAGSRR